MELGFVLRTTLWLKTALKTMVVTVFMAVTAAEAGRPQ